MAQATFQFVRELPVELGWDVVVAGGGPAGVAAAVCAGRLGARVLLVEATGCLGGTSTSGLVTAFDPMADGERMLVGGVMREIVTTMDARGWLGPQVTSDFYSRRFHYWTPFQVEKLKLLLDELVIGAGVEVRFFTRVIDAETTGQRVDGVVLNNIEGHRYVRAGTFIDCTGNAELTALCGAAVREAGRDTPRIMPPTLCSQFTGIDWTRASSRPDATGPDGQQQLLEQAIADGFFSHRDRHLPGAFRTGPTTATMNVGHVFNLDALRCRSLSDGMMHGRRLAAEYLEFYRRYVPGFEQVEHVTTASLMGIRESRRIVGEYELTFDDYLARRTFPDQIAVFNKAVDIHVYDDSDAEYERYYREFHEYGRLKPGEYFGIPYRILVPRGWENLWVAGRCNSSDVQVHGSIRVQPAAAMMGQAAGTAAVQALRGGQTACGLDTDALVATLRAHGAYLPEAD